MSTEEPDSTQQSTAPVPIPVIPAQPAISKRPVTDRAKETANRWYRIVRAAVLLILTVLAVVFIIQNFDDVTFDYVISDTQIPLSLIMVGFLGTGIAIGWLIHWFSARRRQRAR